MEEEVVPMKSTWVAAIGRLARGSPSKTLVVQNMDPDLAKVVFGR